MLIPHFSQPLQTNFPVHHKILYRKTKTLLKKSFVIGTKYLKILHGTVFNGAEDRLSLFRDAPLEIGAAGGEGRGGEKVFGCKNIFKKPAFLQ